MNTNHNHTSHIWRFMEVWLVFILCFQQILIINSRITTTHVINITVVVGIYLYYSDGMSLEWQRERYWVFQATKPLFGVQQSVNLSVIYLLIYILRWCIVDNLYILVLSYGKCTNYISCTINYSTVFYYYMII